MIKSNEVNSRQGSGRTTLRSKYLFFSIFAFAATTTMHLYTVSQSTSLETIGKADFERDGAREKYSALID